MLPILIGGAALGAWWLKRHHQASKALTPERAAIHGHLMQNEFRPSKLRHMAALFGEEGLTDHAKALTWKANEVQKQAKAAASLIEMARAGDQNAMGLIAATRENALQGNTRARVTCALMMHYCMCRPMPQLGPLGEMPVESHSPEPTSPQMAFEEAQRQGYIGSPFMSAA